MRHGDYYTLSNNGDLSHRICAECTGSLGCYRFGNCYERIGGRLSYSKACGVLIPRPGIKPVPYTRRQILNHWTTRESPLSCFWSRDFKWFFKWRNLSRDCLIKYHPLHHGPLEFWSLWRLPKSVITDVNAYRKKPVGKYKSTNQTKCSIAGRGEVCGKLECMNFHIPIKL